MSRSRALPAGDGARGPTTEIGPSAAPIEDLIEDLSTTTSPVPPRRSLPPRPAAVRRGRPLSSGERRSLPAAGLPLAATLRPGEAPPPPERHFGERSGTVAASAEGHGLDLRRSHNRHRPETGSPPSKPHDRHAPPRPPPAPSSPHRHRSRPAPLPRTLPPTAEPDLETTGRRPRRRHPTPARTRTRPRAATGNPTGVALFRSSSRRRSRITADRLRTRRSTGPRRRGPAPTRTPPGSTATGPKPASRPPSSSSRSPAPR